RSYHGGPMRSFAARRHFALLVTLAAVAKLAGCVAAHRDDPGDRPDEFPPPMQWGAGEGSRVLAFSPDGRTLFTGGESLQCWDVTTGKQTAQQGLHFEALSISPDGTKLALQRSIGIIGEPTWALRFQEIGAAGAGKELWSTTVGKGAANSA